MSDKERLKFPDGFEVSIGDEFTVVEEKPSLLRSSDEGDRLRVIDFVEESSGEYSIMLKNVIGDYQIPIYPSMLQDALEDEKCLEHTETL